MQAKDAKYQAFVDEVVNWADSHGYDSRIYSGRAMYGRRCIGIVIPSCSIICNLYFHLGYEQGCADEPQTLALPMIQFDDMGRDLIAYWPHVEVDS
jgi:hypothetical protein